MPLFSRMILVAIFIALGSFSLASPYERIGNFALLDQHGNYHELRKYGDSKAVVLISTSSDCTDSINQLPKYRLLRSNWERKGVTFLGLESSQGSERADVELMDKLHHFDMPILLDDAQLVAESLGISQVGQIAIIEPMRSQLLYLGGLESEPLLLEGEVSSTRQINFTLEEVLQLSTEGEVGDLHGTQYANVSGCELDFPSLDKHRSVAPSYAADIVPILQKNCISCHVEGGVAPFAMDSHMMIQGWSSMMREVLMTKRMPPAQVDPHVNHFQNARYISSEDLQTLVHWIDAGSPRGEGEDPLIQVPSNNATWELGEPDYIVKVPGFTVPATGVLDYENVTINLPFQEDVWVKSVQHLPGDRRVLHHLLSFIVPADYDERIVEGENNKYREFLEGYAPGKESASTFPEGSGVFIPAGSAIQMSVHYTTFGKEALDETQIGLYFADTEPKHEYSTYSLSHGGKNIRIPAGVKDHKMSASHVFEDEIVLHGLRPHMHYRGKNMRMHVVYPNGTTDEIINVPNYSFSWQPTYRLTEPMLLPAGSRVMIEGSFDNSEFNLGNPDPDAVVKGGAQSWDEMFIGYFSYHKTDM